MVVGYVHTYAPQAQPGQATETQKEMFRGIVEDLVDPRHEELVVSLMTNETVRNMCSP